MDWTILSYVRRPGVYRRGGDSLMGRYFVFRMHPLSIAELAHARVPKVPIPAAEGRA